ncbi:hypothetical protein [Frigoriglobus tundricola]|uniref:Uncharacterized protein n=1 Tax=Frigoriglobus tundricola TaxID=2774151 RepID=A0A6M5YJH3_9BACT|nr:hypothetical protein [Frigoriglobus tundricola]QJW93112.1 hypothetical protein FTUN_0615 [Frigoriglobus tundricola]QJX01233.1 hypothetical protein FTUN_8872 [Frigoriglobus tundricola]
MAKQQLNSPKRSRKSLAGRSITATGSQQELTQGTILLWLVEQRAIFDNVTVALQTNGKLSKRLDNATANRLHNCLDDVRDAIQDAILACSPNVTPLFLLAIEDE